MNDATTSPEDAATVTLREVTKETVRAVLRLKVRPEQEAFVANNAVSIAQAYFEPKAWFRAIYAGEEPVGFLMLYDDPETPEYFLWRFMVDAAHQGKGYGKQALNLLVEHVRGRPGATTLGVSYVPGEGSPEGFYRAYGFVPTGEMDGDEAIAQLALA